MKLRIKPTTPPAPEFIPMLAEISMMVRPVALAMLPGVVIPLFRWSGTKRNKHFSGGEKMVRRHGRRCALHLDQSTIPFPWPESSVRTRRSAAPWQLDPGRHTYIYTGWRGDR